MPNRFTPIQPDTPDDQRLAIINKNFGDLDNETVKKIYYGSDGQPRIYIDGTSGTIKVAPEGTNVTTATDAELNFNSAQNVFKVVASGTVTIPSAGPQTGPVDGRQVVSVSHGLGYIPAFVYYPLATSIYFNGTFIANNSRLLGVNSWSADASTNETHSVGAAINETSVVFYDQWSIFTTGTPAAVEVKYYLLQETAN